MQTNSYKSRFWFAWIFLLIIIIIQSACTPEQRLARLLKRHPELIKTDTVFISDTTIIPPASTDTLIYYKQTDTVIVKENGVTIKYFYNTKDSTVYIRGERDTITIIKQVPVQVNSASVEPESFWGKAWRITKDFLLVALLGAFVALFLLLRKKLK